MPSLPDTSGDHGAARDHAVHVAKLGGSLLDVPDLFERLARWCAGSLGSKGVLLVGGGAAADVVRAFDQRHGLDEAVGHWAALAAMRVNMLMVEAAWTGGVRRAADRSQCEAAWEAGRVALVDPVAWLEVEHAAGVTIPHRWTFTSDSIAAHLARRLHAQRLTLLKSTLPDLDMIEGLTQLGVVDEDFAEAAAGIDEIALVNLRVDPPRRLLVTRGRLISAPSRSL